MPSASVMLRVTGGGSAGICIDGRDGDSRRGPEGRGADVGRYGGRCGMPGRCGYWPGRGGMPGCCVRTGCEGSGRGPPGGPDGRGGYVDGRGPGPAPTGGRGPCIGGRAPG